MPSPFEHFASLQSSFSCHLSSTNIAVFPAKSLEDFFFLSSRTPQQALSDRPKVDLALIEQARWDAFICGILV